MVRPDASWCSLCHADLRSDEEKAAARSSVPAWGEEAGPDPASWAPTELLTARTAAATPTEAEVETEVEERRGRHARHAAPVGTAPAGTAPVATAPVGAEPGGIGLPAAGSVGGSDPDAVLAKVGVDVDAMMSLLASDQSKALTPLSSRLSSKGNRAIAVLVAAGALTAGGILLMTVLGLFVH